MADEVTDGSIDGSRAPIHPTGTGNKLKPHFTRFSAATILLSTWMGVAVARDAVMEGKQNWLFAGWESLTVAKPAAEKQSVQLIADVDRMLAAKDIKLIVMIIPIKPRYYQALLPDGATISEPVQKRYDYLLTELKAAAVTTVDVRDALKDAIEKKHEVFYRADFHWTTFAAEATADRMAAAIKGHGPLPGKAGSGMQLGEWINDRHLGDLAANFLSPERKRTVGPESYTIRKPASGAANLLDSEPAPVAVVGNSFVQPYFGFPQRLSNMIDRPVSLKWNPGDIGPWFSFLQYVESAEFSTNRPKFLVWQFNEAQVQNGPDAAGDWAPQSILSPADWRSRVSSAVSNPK
jgi:alginate O-acetyltransferase complex protein AlgJ